MRAYLDATKDLSVREAVRRSGVNFEAIRSFRNNTWKYMQTDTRAIILAYLERRGLLPPETDDGDLSSFEDLPFSEAEELIRSFKRFWKLGVFHLLGPGLTESEIAEKIVQAAKDDGLPARDPAEMARLLRWQASLLESHLSAPEPEITSNAVARRAGARPR